MTKNKIVLVINNESFEGKIAIEAVVYTKTERSEKTVTIKNYFLIDLNILHMYVDMIMHETKFSELSSTYFRKLKRRAHCTLSS